MKPELFEEAWRTAPDRPALGTDEVHVWCVKVNEVASGPSKMGCILSVEEREKAARLRFDRDRRRFVIRHVMLRIVLARYLDEEPAALRFLFGPHGKPMLGDGGDKAALSFNMSHSADIALCAVTRNRRVGLDVEWCLRKVDDVEMAGWCFSTREAETLRELPVGRQVHAFFALWTCKEAYLKAVGRGMSFPMNEVEVSLSGGSRPKLESIGGSNSAARRWSCRQLMPVEDYDAAVVAEGNDWKLSRWVLPPSTVDMVLLP